MKFPITGINGYTKKVGTLARCGCPSCYKRGAMILLETGIRPKIYYIPTIKLQKRTIALCLSCYSRFIPSKKALRQGKKSPNSLIWPEEFTKVPPLL